MTSQVHNTVKAIIRDDHRLLAVRCRDGDSVYYTLPGGQQRSGELLTVALERECLEEIGCPVVAGDLLLVCERPDYGLGHMVDHYFICELPPYAVPAVGAHPDYRQEAVEWLPKDAVEDYALHPLPWRRVIAGLAPPAATYCGRVHPRAGSARTPTDAILVFIDGTICDRRAQMHLMGTPAFESRESILGAVAVGGSRECIQDLARRYRIVYLGARMNSAREPTTEWLRRAGFPVGDLYLAPTQAERLIVVRQIREAYRFVAGIGDRWDDNELHLEIGCPSIILQEHAGDWETVRRHLLR